MYNIIVTHRDPETGDISSTLGTKKPLLFHHTAMEIMERIYKEELNELQLEDNGAADKDGSAIPGGYITEDEAGIYDMCEYANEQLLLTVAMQIVRQ